MGGGRRKSKGGYQADGTWKNLSDKEQKALREACKKIKGLESVDRIRDLSCGITGPVWAMRFSKARRKLALELHPDKGGRTKDFQDQWAQMLFVTQYRRMEETPLIDLTSDDDDDDNDDNGISDLAPMDLAPERGEDDAPQHSDGDDDESRSVGNEDDAEVEVGGDPAARPLLSIAQNASLDCLLGTEIRMDCYFEGVVDEIWNDKNGNYYHHVGYPDEDEEDLSYEELRLLAESENNQVDDFGNKGYKFLKNFPRNAIVRDVFYTGKNACIKVHFEKAAGGEPDVDYIGIDDYHKYRNAFIAFEKQEDEKMKRGQKKPKTKSTPTDETAKTQRKSCGKCGPCITTNCKACKFCIDRMSGRRKLRKRCVLRQCEKLHKLAYDRCGECKPCKSANCQKCDYCESIINEEKTSEKCCEERQCVGRNGKKSNG